MATNTTTPATPATPATVDITFTATITTEANSGWTCVIMPASGEVFGTRKPVKVTGTINGQDFAATLLPVGDGTHMVPLKAALRKHINKTIGDTVTVKIQQRVS